MAGDNDIAARLAALQGNPAMKNIPGIFSCFGGAIQRPSLQSLSLINFDAKPGSPFAAKGKQTALMSQIQYEQQRCSQVRQDGDAVLQQAMAAAAPVQGSIQGGGGSFIGNGLGGMGLGGGNGIDFA